MAVAKPRQVGVVAHVALIETYPYEAVWGGDAVYLDAIRCFLTERGHSVDSYVTDVARGRSKPIVSLKTEARRNHCWHVRNAVPLGSSRFCSLDPRFVAKGLRRLPGRRAPKEDGLEPAEAEWIADDLRDLQPDLAILAFGACALSERIAAIGVKVLALKGFFSDRRIRLGDALPTPFVSAELLDSLAHATTVGFNNRHDLELYTELSGRNHGSLVGVGFPDRRQAPSDLAPSILYVAASTKPNIESLDWFLERVWPLVHSHAPEVELRVAGSICEPFASHAVERLRLLGFVDDIEHEYRKSWSVVAPFVNGSTGVKTKVAEALSYGRPVVTTSIGVDPERPDQFGDAVVAADEPREFAAALLRVLSDDRVRHARHAQAAEQFARHFTPEAAYRGIVELVEPSAARLEAATV